MKTASVLSMKVVWLGLGASLATAPAAAADKELLDILLANGAITEAQYDQLLEKESLDADDARDVVVNMDSGGLSIASDGFEFELGGRVHTDYTHHDYDSRIGADPVNGSQIRRARLEMNGRLHERWGWVAEVDFQDNKVGVKDFRVGYEADRFSLYAGSQKTPYSLSWEMSSNDIPFMERSIDSALLMPYTDRALGVRLETSGNHWFFAGGVFGERVSPGGAGDEGWGPAARFVYSPVITDNAVVHLAARGVHREVGDAQVVEFSDETKDYLSQLSIVDTGAIAGADTITAMGPEIALAYGPFLVFGEYNQVEVGRTEASDLDFDSWHVAGAWALTGETRAAAYRMDAGEFKGLVPLRDFNPATGAYGAFELAARYASIDLNDGGFTGGSEERLDTSLNWYPNRNIRFMFNWGHVLDTDESNLVRLHAPGMNIFSLRGQYNF